MSIILQYQQLNNLYQKYVNHLHIFDIKLQMQLLSLSLLLILNHLL